MMIAVAMPARSHARPVVANRFRDNATSTKIAPLPAMRPDRDIELTSAAVMRQIDAPNQTAEASTTPQG